MKVSFAILASDELTELNNLLNQLTQYKRTEDEICVLLDSSKTNDEVRNLLKEYNIQYYERPLNKDFGSQKTALNKLCKGDWIINLDGDELLSNYLMENYVTILEYQTADVIWVPRVNIVEGITIEHIKKWNWQISYLSDFKRTVKQTQIDIEQLALLKQYSLITEYNKEANEISYYIPIINWPDVQCRIYKNKPNIKWTKPLHESLTGYQSYTSFPEKPQFAIMHFKDIKRQVTQNDFYDNMIKISYW